MSSLPPFQVSSFTPVFGVAQMVETARAFQDARAHVLSNIGADAIERIAGFEATVVRAMKPYMLVTPEGVTEVSRQVFESDILRDYLLTLHFAYVARAALGEVEMEALIDRLARGCSGVVPGASSMAPTAVAMRLPVLSTTVELLTANGWLVVLLLLQLFVTAKP